MWGYVMIKNIYEECPMYQKKFISLRQTNIEDAEELYYLSNKQEK